MSPRKYPKEEKSPLNLKNQAIALKESDPLKKIGPLISNLFSFSNPKKTIKESKEEDAPQEVKAAPPVQEIVQEVAVPKGAILRQKVEEDFNLIEYDEGYHSPSHYFVKDSPYGRVYKVNRPKNNFVVVN